MATQPSDYTELPSEIIIKPVALIGVSGLDIINNAIHKAIWDAFSNNRRADRAPVRFKLLHNTFEFPVVKPKRNSYEWYIPKGILKKNWINKRLNMIPAVVVIFYDMEWNDPQWNEKIIECASRVQSIRAAVEGHSTKVAVVVVQSGLSPPPSEYLLGAERAQALCAACEIQSKSLFVLPHGDHLIGYIVRLENAFYDLAQNYYHHETKNIKQHRDHLNKTTHQYLFVRHQFKLGYLNELKQDQSTAHKHYMHAYNNLLEARMVDTNTYEIKSVAGYLNYKLCKLLFALNLPRDAITQFKLHIDKYKNRVGVSELLFEHYAWVARQYTTFGELFDEAIRSGLPAIQSQHPGFYYQQAAQFTVKRRQAMRSVCSEVLQYPPPPDPLEGMVDFYGQRVWRPGRLSADPHDPQKEQAAILALQFKERNFNHSSMIISFLGSAISQFKTFHSPRMRKQLVVEMANEYYLCADYGKALTLLTHMLWDYRREKWWYLASHILNRALQCAYLSAKIQDYLQLAIEGLSKHIMVTNNDKERIFHNILSVINMTIPNPEPDLPMSSQSTALEVWKLAIDKEPMTVTVDMSNISSFLEVKPRFKQPAYKLDDQVTIEIYVRLTYPALVKIKGVYVTIASHSETIEITVTEEGNSAINLKGGEVRKFTSQFKPNPEDSGTDLHINNVMFVLGKEKKRKLILNFKMNESNFPESSVHPELLHFLSSPKANHDFDGLIPLTVAHVTARESNLLITFKNESPALQGEWFPTTFSIRNDEKFTIQNMNVVVSLINSPDNPNPETVAELSFSPFNTQLPLQLSVEALSPLSISSNTFYLKSNRTTTVAVLIKVSYILDQVPRVECSKDFTVKVAVIKPFDVSVKFFSMKFQSIEKCYVDDPLVVMPEIKILCPWKLTIVDTELEVADCYSNADEEKPESCLKGLEIGEGVIAVDAFCVYANSCPKDLPSRVGLYNIQWKRTNSVDDKVIADSVLSSTTLPGIPIQPCPITVTSNLPEMLELQTSVPLTCTLKGNMTTPARLDVSVDGTDAFMFAGYKKRSITVQPHDNEELNYNLHPLVCGNTNLPKLKPMLCNVKNIADVENDIVVELFDKSLPQSIYVMPKYK